MAFKWSPAGQLFQDAPVTVPTHPLKKFAEVFLRVIFCWPLVAGETVLSQSRLHGRAAHLCKCYIDRLENLQP